MRTVIIPPCDGKERLSDFLRRQGVFLSSPCGDRGVCGKCRVKVKKGEFLSVTDGSPVIPDENGYVLSCRVLCPKNGGEIEVSLDGEKLVFTKESSYTGEVDVALDIGTTTLAMSFLSACGETLATLSLLNPQKAFGGDVITRISKSDAHLRDMQECVLQEIRNATASFSEAFPNTVLNRLSVAGNPTMLHIFCGISPKTLGAYPFTPVFTEMKVLTGEELNLPFKEITLLPSSSAFIGSDVINGVAVCKMTGLDSPSLLIDIGTNGEMILCTGRKNGSRLLGTSAAAGPALEGANISCGVGGVTGGVSKVTQSGNGLVFSTVNDGEPIGICGSGLIDLVSCLLESEIIDETGYMEEGFTLCGIHKTEKGLSDTKNTPVILTQKDVRELQLAKSAIRAGIDILLDSSKLKATDLSHVFIAGGLGYYTDPLSAVRTGLLPREFLGKTKAVGNTALKGATMSFSPSVKEEICRIAKNVETVELNNSPKFPSLFAEYMMFCE